MPQHPMFKLLADNRKTGFFRAETDSDAATVYLYDVIAASDGDAAFWGGVSPESFVKSLNGIKASVINLRINSPGGDVFAARAMEQAIRGHGAKIVAHIDGYAASAASILAIAADEVVIAQGGFFMIHKAWTLAWGNADDMLNTADLLEKIDGTLAETYAARTGQDVERIMEMMKAETWFTAQEALDNGFADKLAEAAPKNKTAWNMSAYARAPKIPAPEFSSDKNKHTDFDALRRRLRVVEKAA